MVGPWLIEVHVQLNRQITGGPMCTGVDKQSTWKSHTFRYVRTTWRAFIWRHLSNGNVTICRARCFGDSLSPLHSSLKECSYATDVTSREHCQCHLLQCVVRLKLDCPPVSTMILDAALCQWSAVYVISILSLVSAADSKWVTLMSHFCSVNYSNHVIATHSLYVCALV